MERQFEISVVMPIYKVEKYLREAIESVVNQTIGFEENIQLILVNDGSPDNSETICQEYQKKYPSNIIYVFQENAGVSAARNIGMQYIQGKYVNFMDSDDIWDVEAFKNFEKFFNQHNGVDIAVASMKLFGASKGYHPLNYRQNKGERVADIFDSTEYNSIVMHVTNVLFRNNVISGLKFQDNISYSEDSLFINTVILKTGKIGFAPQAIHNYRKRIEGSSALQQSMKDAGYYVESLDEFPSLIGEISCKIYNEVIPYIQNVIYYDLAWRFHYDTRNVLDNIQKNTFLKKSSSILQKIDDSVILLSKVHSNFVYKNIAWKLKYNHDLTDDIDILDDGTLLANGKFTTKTSSKGMCKINFLNVQGGMLIVDGTVSKWLFRCTQLVPIFVASFGKEEYLPIIWENVNSSVKTINGEEHYQYYFRFVLPLRPPKINKKKLLRIAFIFKGKQYNMGMHYSRFVPNWNQSRGIYQQNGKMIIIARRMAIEFRRPRNLLLEELKLQKEQQQWMRGKGFKKIANYRIRYLIHKRVYHSKKKIWLISDREMNAGDNGEAFFKYLNSFRHSDIKPIFVISKKADCVSRLKKEGRVIFLESKKYPTLFLDASKIISSSANEFTLNPFGEDRIHVEDFIKSKFFYLQHGVACADLSSWLNRYNKNIELLFTSSNRESNSYIYGAYGYTDKNVVITGQSRFDALYDKKEKNILILPTWRKSIKTSYDENTTTSIYYEDFKNTAYFQFYNSLINHPRLLKQMREKGYKGTFCLHPIHMEQWIDFDGNDIFSVNQGYVDYFTAFAKAALTLTDYSSVIFDFAYLRKYIIYGQFDKKAFYEGQIYDEGYFNYENDGFGPVCYDLESTVDALIEAIDADCVVPQKYLDRMNNFFAFNDRNNCDRIYNAIREHDAEPFVPPDPSPKYVPSNANDLKN